MSTENELMKLVADYGKECLLAGIADLVAADDLKQRQADDVRKSHDVLTARLRALLSELEAAREDAKNNKVDADCFRWWVHEAEVNPGLVAKAIAHCISEDDYRAVICGAMEAKNDAINAARKGKS